MIRNLKALGATALAVVGVVAVNAGSASASGETFHTVSSHTLLHVVAPGNQVFTTTAGTVTCTSMRGSGTTTAWTSSALTIEGVSYIFCTTKTIFGNLSATVDFKGCDYLLTADTTQPTHIVCPAGAGPITISAPGCTITIGAQTVYGVTYSNSSPYMNIYAGVNNIKSTATGFACSATGTSNHGSYTGSMWVEGETTAGSLLGISYG